ncbi:MAG: hypothetical protein ACYDH6_02945 [Acidimicrobiales bacterium]
MVRGFIAGVAVAVFAASVGIAGAIAPRVLRVGTYRGVRGDFASIQAAVNAARPGDWVLVAPGDYHERGSNDAKHPAGVYITTPGVHLRGLDRNHTVVDGTRANATTPCAKAAALQDLGPKDRSGQSLGRNGIWVSKADGVSIENLTVCNFLTDGNGHQGNQIWWNGGDSSGQIHLGAYRGAYLTASTSYTNGAANPAGEYGIFVSNARGPGLIAHTYASNMADSAYYVGACPDCNATIVDAHAEHSALGFSGTNAGGHLVIQGSRWDDNKSGMAPNVLNNDDAPSPQDGACPGTSTQIGPGLSTGPARHCTIIDDNVVDHNNDPNVPGSGIAGSAPVGTGIELSGTENILVRGNSVHDNGAWGIVVHDYPDTETPPPVAHCQGGVGVGAAPACLFQAYGNEVASNRLAHNGFFGNLTNGDLADDTSPHAPGNCFHDNVDVQGLRVWPPTLVTPLFSTCGIPNGGDLTILTVELLCDSGVFGTCPKLPGVSYPSSTGVTLLPIPFAEPTMPNPCAGVPPNPWCTG